PPPNQIDVGASPGGWTSYLAPRCRRVLAVDPAEMESSVLALPNVVHVRKMIQDARGELLGILAGNWPEEEEKGGRKRSTGGCDRANGAATWAAAVGAADLLVSDMNAEPQVVADVLLSAMAAGLAKPGALVVATLKDF
ncbi:unnamed protein product, partial [Laminaria digitata]